MTWNPTTVSNFQGYEAAKQLLRIHARDHHPLPTTAEVFGTFRVPPRVATTPIWVKAAKGSKSRSITRLALVRLELRPFSPGCDNREVTNALGRARRVP